MNTDTQIFELLEKVAYKTALEMGDQLLEMSCFLSKWSELAVAEDQPLAA